MYHAPTDCATIRKWLTKCADDSETANYISAHTKDVRSVPAVLCRRAAGLAGGGGRALSQCAVLGDSFWSGAETPGKLRN